MQNWSVLFISTSSVRFKFSVLNSYSICRKSIMYYQFFIIPQMLCRSLGISKHTLWSKKTNIDGDRMGAAAGGGKRRQILTGWMCGAAPLLWGHHHQLKPLHGYVFIITTAHWNKSNWFMCFMFSPWEDCSEPHSWNVNYTISAGCVHS